ncbi:MAG: hypothetical protein KatS3mg110_4682 [Pirellulaceae bacterium]|nr:MAG: hypothetical protein KatS3mg110_4682 [Pirellulaceae bacterium]
MQLPPPATFFKRSGHAWMAWAAVSGTVLAIVLYALAASYREKLVEVGSAGSTARGQTEFSLDRVRLHLLEGLTVVWLFFVGGSFGSFLNVVVYRLPRGLTLWGSSKCPSCGHPIRLRHNIPVLSWFFLDGRCYDCGVPISARYPLVEGVVGSFFIALAAAEWFSGGSSLPWRPVNVYRGIAWAVFDPQWDLVLIFTTHAALLWILLAWALMELDGCRVPRRFVVAAYVAALLIGPLFPFVQPVPWWAGLVGGKAVGGGALTTLAGMVIGWGVGGVLWALADQRPLWRHARIAGLAGAILGWQSVVSIALWSTVTSLLAVGAVRWATPKARSGRSSAAWEPEFFQVQLAGSPAGPAGQPHADGWTRYRGLWLWAGVLLHLLTWRLQSGNGLWPGPDAGPVTALVGTVLSLSASAGIAWLYRRSCLDSA